MKFAYSNPEVKKMAYRLLPVADYAKLLFSRKDIAIHGSYFTTNIGDRAIGIVLRDELKKKGYSSVLISRFCSHPPVKNIVVGGGGVIHNHYDRNLELRTAFVDGKRNVMYIGVGCPGFAALLPDDRDHLEKLERAGYVSVRDERSKSVLTEQIDIDPEVLACPAWLFDRHLDASDFSVRNALFRAYYNLRYGSGKKSIPPAGGDKIGVVLNGHFDLLHLEKIKARLNDLALDNSLYFIPFVGEDLEFFRDKLSDLPMTCLKLRGPAATYNTLLAMNRIVATRYHSVIFSLLAGKPVMILGYSEKVISLARDLRLAYADLIHAGEQIFQFNENVDKGLLQRKIGEAERQIDRIISHLK